ncbi:response regulator transcription factor [Bdellovibrio sp. HCB337]|uniref:response regulator transcription factor n=1 Tax=Bdellovibrio sp. HCB337 TaxID=3394358 RepID=UPI0039A677FC
MMKILLVEDSPDCQNLIQLALGKKHFIRTVSSAEDARAELHHNPFDLLILDIELPGIDGIKFCAEIKASEQLESLPIIFVSSRDGIEDKVLGFSVGADDYIQKPFDLRELHARVEAKLRRRIQEKERQENYVSGAFRVNINQQKIFLITDSSDVDLSLSSLEFKLLLYFLNHEGHILTRSQIIDRVWGQGTNVGERTVDTHVYILRKKLISKSGFIQSVPGEGYKFIQSSL